MKNAAPAPPAAATKVRKPYTKRKLTHLGSVRNVTLGQSNGAPDLQGMGTGPRHVKKPVA